MKVREVMAGCVLFKGREAVEVWVGDVHREEKPW
jgi:hypothetical protein